MSRDLLLGQDRWVKDLGSWGIPYQYQTQVPAISTRLEPRRTEKIRK